jgi:UDP:flavonoid glycosyltransferase YjiC (YdhE family)
MSAKSARLLLAFPHGGFLAHTVRLLEISKILREQGYHVLFFSQGVYTELVSQAGFDVQEIFTLDPKALMDRLRHGDVEFYSQETYDRSVQEELRVLKQHQPAGVLGDHRWSLRSSTEIAGVPYVSVLNASWTRFWELPLRPYYHHPATRALGGGRLARLLIGPLLPLLAGLFKKAGAREQNRWRREKGLKEYDVHLQSFEGDLNLLADIPEYSPCKALPPNFRYVGPLFWEPDVPVPAWLEAYDKSRPVVYLTFGSTGLPQYFPVVLDLLRDQDVDVIVTTAGLAEIPNPPQNCRVAEILPGSSVQRIADLMVCHGGNGTIYQALSAGVPLVGIPTCITQEIEMDQVERMGCGLQVNEVRFRTKELAHAIQRVLSEPSFTQQARAIQNAILPCRPRERAADEITRFLARL